MPIIFCRPDQIKDEFKSIIDIMMHNFQSLNFNDFTAQVSLRDPDKQAKIYWL